MPLSPSVDLQCGWQMVRDWDLLFVDGFGPETFIICCRTKLVEWQRDFSLRIGWKMYGLLFVVLATIRVFAAQGKHGTWRRVLLPLFDMCLLRGWARVCHETAARVCSVTSVISRWRFTECLLYTHVHCWKFNFPFVSAEKQTHNDKTTASGRSLTPSLNCKCTGWPSVSSSSACGQLSGVSLCQTCCLLNQWYRNCKRKQTTKLHRLVVLLL